MTTTEIAFLAALVLMLPVQGEAQAPDAARRAEEVVDRLAAGDVDAVRAGFDARVSEALPAERLRTVWPSLVGQFGAYGGHERAAAVAQGATTVAALTCRFEKGNLVARVSFDASGKISGLFFSPAPAPTPTTWPAPPYARTESFAESAVVVDAGAGFPLPGTLTSPVGAGPFPAVALVHGSGPNDRDETVGAVKPFRDLAWGLASRGIVVLRYEKRTKEHAARLAADRTLTVKEEVVDDALAAVALLRRTPRVAPRKVFVLGHSLGGTLLPAIAARDRDLAGLVSMAGATRPIDEMIRSQTVYLLEKQGVPEEARRSALEGLDRELARARGDVASEEAVLGAFRPYWKSLLAWKPLEAARKLRTPFLALQGERDYQVTLVDLAGWRRVLEPRGKATFLTYPKLNHLMVEGDGPSVPSEYEKPGHVAEAVVADVAAWITGR